MKANPISMEGCTPELIGREVMIAGGEGGRGKVVSVDGSFIYAVWPKNPEPKRHRRTELWLVEKDPFLKSIKWAGNTFGALEDFVEQAKREGVGRSAILNESPREEHVHIRVELPLATNTVVHKHGPADPHIPGECS